VNQDTLLLDTLIRLDRAGVSYMVTGSMASNFWGIPRTTHDLDFVIQLPPAQVPALVEAFEDQFYIDEAMVRSAYQPPHQFNAIDSRSTLKIDFWLLKPVPFEHEMFRRRTAQSIFGREVWLATAEDVILHKPHWDRITPSERQRLDIAGVAAVQQGQLDADYLRHWAREMQLCAAVEDVLAGTFKPKTT
jgi:hypothetical protein